MSAQDTRENALARFSHPPTADEQGFWSGYLMYQGVCYNEMVELEACSRYQGNLSTDCHDLLLGFLPNYLSYPH